jgi:hypothetical protein
MRKTASMLAAAMQLIACVGTTKTAVASPESNDTTKLTFSQRVAKVRQLITEKAQSVGQAGNTSASINWVNWRNWGNWGKHWHNWHNWRNWPNWRNWRNWHNW